MLSEEITAILLLSALDEEISGFVSALGDRSDEQWRALHIWTGTLEQRRVVVAKTGVGKSMAALVAQALVDRYRPEAVFFSGIAGALDPALQIGDLLVADDCLQYDLDARPLGFLLGEIPHSGYRVLPSDATLLSCAKEFRPRGFRVVCGRVLTGDRFLTAADKASSRHLTEELGGSAVDMEGASAGLVAAFNGLPFILVRAISDRADGTSPRSFARFLHEASLRTSQLIAFLLARWEGAAQAGDPPGSIESPVTPPPGAIG